jgi:hypothetical protein
MHVAGARSEEAAAGARWLDGRPTQARACAPTADDARAPLDGRGLLPLLPRPFGECGGSGATHPVLCLRANVDCCGVPAVATPEARIGWVPRSEGQPASAHAVHELEYSTTQRPAHSLSQRAPSPSCSLADKPPFPPRPCRHVCQSMISAASPSPSLLHPLRPKARRGTSAPAPSPWTASPAMVTKAKSPTIRPTSSWRTPFDLFSPPP